MALIHVEKNVNNKETIDPLFAHTTISTSLDNDFQWENVCPKRYIETSNVIDHTDDNGKK